MLNRNSCVLKFLFVFSFTLMLLAGAIQPVHAQGEVDDEKIPAGTVVSDDIFLIGDNVEISGTVDGL